MNNKLLSYSCQGMMVSWTNRQWKEWRDIHSFLQLLSDFIKLVSILKKILGEKPSSVILWILSSLASNCFSTFIPISILSFQSPEHRASLLFAAQSVILFQHDCISPICFKHGSYTISNNCKIKCRLLKW